MAEGWREVLVSVERARKVAMPWKSVKGYHLQHDVVGTRVVCVLTRETPLGQVLGRVVSTTTFPGRLTEEQARRGAAQEISDTIYEIGGGGLKPKAMPTLAEALADVDAELEVGGYEVVGRVVWD